MPAAGALTQRQSLLRRHTQILATPERGAMASCVTPPVELGPSLAEHPPPWELLPCPFFYAYRARRCLKLDSTSVAFQFLPSTPLSIPSIHSSTIT
jgi:hypothetical protein